MKKEIEEAMQLIQSIPQDLAEVMHDILTWDEEKKLAFMMAYRIIYDN